MWHLISYNPAITISVIFCGFIISFFGFFLFFYRRKSKKLVSKSINQVLEIFSKITDHKDLFDNYDAVRSQLLGNQVFQNIWEEFEETLIIDTDDQTIVATKRPHEYLNDSSIISPFLDLRLMHAMPNYLVGLGLALTFCGLVWAIYLASQGLSNPDGGKEALNHLLQTAGVKFLTSITGLFCSMIFSFCHRHWLNKLHKKINEICSRIEKLTFSVTTEQLLRDSLKDQKKQTVLLEHLGGEIARQLENALADKLPISVGAALNPLIEELRQLAKNQTSNNNDGLEQMLKSFTNKLEGAAHNEIQDLVGGLKDIQASLQGLVEHIQNTGDSFGSKIVGAADGLSTTLEKTLHSFTAKLEGAANNEIQELVGGLKEMQSSLQGLLGNIQTTGDAFGSQIVGAAGEISNNLMPVTQNLLTFNENINAINEKLYNQLDRFDNNILSLNSTLQNIKDTADNIHQAGEPVTNAAESIRAAARTIDSSFKQIQESYNHSQQATSAMQQVSEQVATVWSSYQSKFESVDQDMAKAFVSIQDGLKDFQANINSFVGQFEGAFTNAVRQLSAAITDLADERAEFHEYHQPQDTASN
jgi:type VII secretion effector (TIGR04197 family)